MRNSFCARCSAIAALVALPACGGSDAGASSEPVDASSSRPIVEAGPPVSDRNVTSDNNYVGRTPPDGGYASPCRSGTGEWIVYFDVPDPAADVDATVFFVDFDAKAVIAQAPLSRLTQGSQVLYVATIDPVLLPGSPDCSVLNRLGHVAVESNASGYVRAVVPGITMSSGSSTTRNCVTTVSWSASQAYAWDMSGSWLDGPYEATVTSAGARTFDCTGAAACTAKDSLIFIVSRSNGEVTSLDVIARFNAN